MKRPSGNDKSLEAKARRAARAAGLIARKSRQRKNVPNLDNFGGFILVNARHNFAVAGLRYELSADDVLEFCTREGSTGVAS